MPGSSRRRCECRASREDEAVNFEIQCLGQELDLIVGGLEEDGFHLRGWIDGEERSFRGGLPANDEVGDESKRGFASA